MELSAKHFYVLLGWVVWCTLHSALISVTVTEWMKRALGGGFRFYRLFYCAFSVATLVPLMYLSHESGETPLFSWTGPWALVQFLLIALPLYLFFAGGRRYSWARLLGFAQIREGGAATPPDRAAPLVVSGIHRIVRHPWYLGGILLVWAQELSLPTIMNNLVISGYFVVGSYLEELKLVREFGDQYRNYQQTVPILFPWRWLRMKIAALSR